WLIRLPIALLLADWLEAELGPAGLFVADAEGLPLVARGEIAETPVLGSALIRAWRSLASSLGLPEVSPLAADLDEGKRLFVRPAVTPWSLLFLGLITAETPCREDFDSLNQALDTVVGLAS
ncbi:MAG TPA: hypothetical protein PK413_03260, partial [Thermoanaerobaculia bacterium]|nr:hypothetical protein [Thermoanaerobaculia bacterium]